MGTKKLVLGTAFLMAFLGATIWACNVADAADQPKIKAELPKKADDVKPAKDSIRVRVLGPDGHPAAGVSAQISIWSDDKDYKPNKTIETDADGIATFPLPKSYSTARIWTSKEGYATLFANWETAELSTGKKLPEEYTFRMEAAGKVSGRVVNEKGEPIAGAKIIAELRAPAAPKDSDARVTYQTTLAWGEYCPVTDAKGRWELNHVPQHDNLDLVLLVSHKDFISDRGRADIAKASGITAKQLWDGTAKLVMKAGAMVSGTVTGTDGKPVKNAVVISGDDRRRIESNGILTDDQGEFRLSCQPPGELPMTVLAKGFAPQLRKVTLVAGASRQDFRLASGQPVKLTFQDTNGKPIPKVTVSLEEWQGVKSLDLSEHSGKLELPDVGIPKTCDGQGEWQWANAPKEPVKVTVYTRGHISQSFEISGGQPDKIIVMKKDHIVTGKVLDADTGKPIPEFTVIPMVVFRDDRIVSERHDAVAGQNGELKHRFTRTDYRQQLRIEAPGYRTHNGAMFNVGDDDARVQNVRLKKSPARTGVLLNTDGTPAVGANVQPCTATDSVRLPDNDRGTVYVTDAQGRFSFPDPGEAWGVYVTTKTAGAFAETDASTADIGTIKLQAWASVRGRFVDGGKPIAGATVRVGPCRVRSLFNPQFDATHQCQTDGEGRFFFDRLLPGAVSVRVHLGPWEDPGYRSAPSLPMVLKPGETANIVLGKDGTTLSGKVKLTGKVPTGMDCTYSINYLVRREAGVPPSKELVAAGFDATKGWRDTWYNTSEGRAYQSTLQHWFVKLAADGTFRVSGVPAGEYDIVAWVYAKPEGCLVDPLAKQVVRVSVTDADISRGTKTLPDITADVVPLLAVGDKPLLKFKQPDGTDGELKTTNARHTIVQFWASWCIPCKRDMPDLKLLHAEFEKTVNVLSVSIDEDEAAWKKAVTGAGLPWAQGRISSESVPGLSSVPLYWLLDSDGKIVALPLTLSELRTALKKLK